MKIYTIIGGVNGCGKSSLTGTLKAERTDLGIIVDPDKITAELGGDEYEGGKDWLGKYTADAGIKAELDVFWATVAGLDPVAYMKKLGDRLAFVHIKEAAAADPVENAQPVVGEGAVDMHGVFAQMREKKIGWAVLEVEKYPCSEAEYLARSLENMRKLAEEKK